MDTDLETMAMLNTAAVTYQIVLTKADKIKNRTSTPLRRKFRTC